MDQTLSRKRCVILALAFVLVRPYHIEAMPRSCPQEAEMKQEGTRKGETTIIRSGTGHIAVVRKDDADGTIHIEQHGKDHATLAVQSGSGETLAIEQSGADAQANVVQDGACNAVSLHQSGDGATSSVNQSGKGNRVVIRQGPGKGG